jgi:hypothetical protein
MAHSDSGDAARGFRPLGGPPPWPPGGLKYKRARVTVSRCVVAPWLRRPNRRALAQGNGHRQVGPLLILFHDEIKLPEIELTAAKISSV